MAGSHCSRRPFIGTYSSLQRFSKPNFEVPVLMQEESSNERVSVLWWSLMDHGPRLGVGNRLFYNLLLIGQKSGAVFQN
jgi:hypothetical protein